MRVTQREITSSQLQAGNIERLLARQILPCNTADTILKKREDFMINIYDELFCHKHLQSEYFISTRLSTRCLFQIRLSVIQLYLYVIYIMYFYCNVKSTFWHRGRRGNDVSERRFNSISSNPSEPARRVSFCGF